MNTGDRIIRWSAGMAVSIVTGIATVISYGHAHELVLAHGETGRTAAALPLTVDGLIATCSLVIYDCARRDRRAPWHAWALLGAGVVATLGANVAHGLAHGWVGAVVGAWPALVAVGSFELLLRLVRQPERVLLVEEAAPEAPAPAFVFWPQFVAAETEEQPAEVAPEPEVPEIESAVPEAEPAVPPVPEPHPEAVRRFGEQLRHGHVPSIRQIKRELRVGQPRAKEVREHLAVLANR